MTVTKRQLGVDRIDLQLANLFGTNTNISSKAIWTKIETSKKLDNIKFNSWKNYDDLQELILTEIKDELNKYDYGFNDEKNFELSVGAYVVKETGYTYFKPREFCNLDDEEFFYGNNSIDDWQIISPIRGSECGVDALNRLIQTTYRSSWMSVAKQGKIINKPVQPQGIIYGDKVINLKNGKRKILFERGQKVYIANGDIGLVVGHYKKKGQRKVFSNLNVNFPTHSSVVFNYPIGELKGEKGPSPLELAYALTVHKTQGSEFKTTFVVLPENCLLMSRELLYTALTRHTNRIVILYQGKFRELQQYIQDSHSEIARRITNIFSVPDLVSVDEDKNSFYLEKSLMRSSHKSESTYTGSEKIIEEELNKSEIKKFQHKSKLQLHGDAVAIPSFTIVDNDLGTTFYWEHIDYQNDTTHSEEREVLVNKYRESQILPHDEGGGNEGTLIITSDEKNGKVDRKKVAELIAELLK